LKHFVEKNFPRIDPSPLVVWFLVACLMYFFSKFGLPNIFIEQNATLINLQYGAVISTSAVALLIVLLLFCNHDNKFFEYTHWVARLFSDTAMASSGFIVAQELLLREDHIKGFTIFGFSLVYAIVANHLFLFVFDDEKGSRKCMKTSDRKSNTPFESRSLEVKVIAFATVFAVLTVIGLLYGLSKI